MLKLLQAGKEEEAQDLYFESVADARPKLHASVRACALAAYRCRDFEGAFRFAERAVKLKPHDGDGHHLLGLVQRRYDLLTEAARSFRRSTHWKPQSLDGWNNLGLTLEDLGDLDGALEAVENGLALDSEDADLLNLKGSILCSLGRPEEGIAAYRKGLAADEPLPFVRMNLGQALLQSGRMEEGWQEFSHRRALLRPSPVKTDPWEGQDLSGKSIVVWYEQGLGDSVHFCRYLPALGERAEAVTFVCQEHVLEVVGTLRAEVEFTSSTYRPFDFECPLVDLARYVDQAVEVPYLKATGTPHPAVMRGEGLKVGIVISGNPANPTDVRRSLDAKSIRPLLKCVGASFFELGVDHYVRLPGLEAIGIEIIELKDLASTIEALDLVITVDTLAAHLSGALGKPVWNLLAFSPDWRWGLAGERTGWYPSMRLFRQPAPGDWKSVIAEVTKELAALARAHSNAGQ